MLQGDPAGNHHPPLQQHSLQAALIAAEHGHKVIPCHIEYPPVSNSSNSAPQGPGPAVLRGRSTCSQNDMVVGGHVVHIFSIELAAWPPEKDIQHAPCTCLGESGGAELPCPLDPSLDSCLALFIPGFLAHTSFTTCRHHKQSRVRVLMMSDLSCPVAWTSVAIGERGHVTLQCCCQPQSYLSAPVAVGAGLRGT